jgi:hypothetical protein
MPLKFWDEAFVTATYLINRLPSKVTNNVTPLELLLNKNLITSPYAPLVVPVGQTCVHTTIES